MGLQQLRQAKKEQFEAIDAPSPTTPAETASQPMTPSSDEEEMPLLIYDRADGLQQLSAVSFLLPQVSS